MVGAGWLAPWPRDPGRGGGHRSSEAQQKDFVSQFRRCTLAGMHRDIDSERPLVIERISATAGPRELALAAVAWGLEPWSCVRCRSRKTANCTPTRTTDSAPPATGRRSRRAVRRLTAGIQFGHFSGPAQSASRSAGGDILLLAGPALRVPPPPIGPRRFRSKRRGVDATRVYPAPPSAHVLLDAAQAILGHVLRDPEIVLDYLTRTPEGDTWIRHALAVALGLLGEAPEATTVMRYPGAYDDAAARVFATVVSGWGSAADRIRTSDRDFRGGAARVTETAIRRLEAGHPSSVFGGRRFITQIKP